MLKHDLFDWRLLTAVLALAWGQAAFAIPCPPDTDCSGEVNVDDMLTVIDNWGSSADESDINGDGTTDVDDLLAAWGPCVFEFQTLPDAEAHQIGLEMLGPDGPLLLPVELYQRIDGDLELIRAAYPALASQTHSPAWAPNQLNVAVYNYLPQDGFECLNVYYQAVDVELLFIGDVVDYYVVTFAGKLNVEALIDIYQQGNGVSFAEPNGIIGGQNFWEPTDLGGGVWRWEIDDGLLDCFDGCDCHRFYVIETDARGQVQLISCSEVGQNWCDFGGPGCDS